ncbi:MAG: FliH/SctL family protein [Brevinema sp.]
MSVFDIHAKILRRGQYEIKKHAVDVPIKHFNEGQELKKNVQEQIDIMRQEILELEAQLREKRLLSQEQAEQILEQAQDKAKRVLEDAEQHAFDRVQKSLHEKEVLMQQTQEESERIKHQAMREADDLKAEVQRESIKIKDVAEQDGYTKGLNQGLDAGRSEVAFAVERLHMVIAETARERERILVHSEHQVINLVLTMVKKIVKKLSTEHQDVVIENTKAALELLRGAMTLFIRVSPHDFNYTQSFKEELIRKIDSKAELKFIEDPTVDPGGVYIETDTGDVDATIRSQLEELETQMRFYMPIKVHTPEQKPNHHTAEQIIPEIPKDIPKTEFAQREEYISEPVVNHIEDEIIIPTIEESENERLNSQVLHAYQENTESEDTPPHDNIVI